MALRQNDLIRDGSIEWAAAAEVFKNKTFHEDSVTTVTWSDEMFEEQYVPACTLSHGVSLSESVLAAKVFLNWYVEGVTPKAPCDVVLALLYGMTVDGDMDLLFDLSLWGQHAGKTLGNFSAIVKLETITYRNTSQGVTRQAGSAGPSNTGEGGVPVAVTNNDVLLWYKELWENLDTTGDLTVDQVLAKKMTLNYLGFLALTMLRLSTKDTDMVAKHMFDKSMERFQSLWLLKINISKTFPPCTVTMERFRQLFNRFTPNANRCLAAVVYTYGKVTAERAEAVRGILRAGCLLSLQKTGLGCYHWTQRAAETLSIGVLELMRYMAVGSNNITNMAIIEMLRLYADPDAKQYSWPWARMFANGAFMNISIRKNPTYAAVMLGIVTDLKGNHDLWSIASFGVEGMTGIKSTALAVAKNIKPDVNSKRAASGQTDESKAVWVVAESHLRIQEPRVPTKIHYQRPANFNSGPTPPPLIDDENPEDDDDDESDFRVV